MPPVSKYWGMEHYLFIDLFSPSRKGGQHFICDFFLPLLGDSGTKVHLGSESKYIWTAEKEYSELCSTVQMKLHKEQHLYMFGGIFLRLKSK